MAALVLAGDCTTSALFFSQIIDILTGVLPMLADI